MIYLYLKYTISSLIIIFELVSSESIGLRISGGVRTDIKQVPHQISLRSSGLHFCSGSILDQYHVITAAHCVESFVDKMDKLLVVAGTPYLYSSGRAYRVTNVIIHEMFNEPSIINNDIAILVLGTPLKYNARVQPAQLPPKGLYIPEGTGLLVSGWGITEEGGDISSQLRIARVPKIDHQYCESIYDLVLTSKMICAGGNGKGACSSDSGGPLIWRQPKGDLLIGIVSFGQGSCSSQIPNVYSYIPELREWIDGVVGYL